MGIFRDPFLPVIKIPDFLLSKETNNQWYRLGSAKFQLLPKQYEFMHSPEQFLGFVAGYGGGKTNIGAKKAAILSMTPNNRGLVGMETATDLADVAQRDLLDFLSEAELLVKAPTEKKNVAIVQCIDPATNRNLGYTSEIQFAHLDDPKHVRGRHLGWVWVDEASKVKKEAWLNLIGRLRWPAFRDRYVAYATGNPEGHNWLYDFFFNEEELKKLQCGKKGCQLTPEACNKRERQKRRGIHCTTYENYFLPPDYVGNMLSSYSEEERERYLEGSFDIFEGAIFKQFSHDLHVLAAA